MRLGALIAILANFGLAHPLHADANSDAILREAFGKLHAAKSFSADLSATIRTAGAGVTALKGRILALKPNYLRVELKGRTPMRYVCDGKSYYRQVSPTEYVRERAEPRPSVFVGVWEGEIDAFFGGAALVSGLATRAIGTETVAGTLCDVVAAEMKNPTRTVTYAITRKDRLIVRAAIRLGNPPNVQEQINRLQNHRFDVPAAPQDFQFTPDPGMRQRVPPNIVFRGNQRHASPAARSSPALSAAYARDGRREACMMVPPAGGALRAIEMWQCDDRSRAGALAGFGVASGG